MGVQSVTGVEHILRLDLMDAPALKDGFGASVPRRRLLVSASAAKMACTASPRLNMSGVPTNGRRGPS